MYYINVGNPSFSASKENRMRLLLNNGSISVCTDENGGVHVSRAGDPLVAVVIRGCRDEHHGQNLVIEAQTGTTIQGQQLSEAVNLTAVVAMRDLTAPDV